ncbi:MAG: preprotein translocase subunit SecA [Arenicella sp.]
MKAPFPLLSSSSNAPIKFKYRRLIQKIRTKFSDYESLKDDEIASQMTQLRIAVDQTPHQETVVACFALVMQASTRTLGMTHYDVQLNAGLSMIEKTIAEMATGEGKTLVATLPASFFALYGKGVHVMTVNAYLAERDCLLMKPVYELLGLTVGFIRFDIDDDKKRLAYGCDITYGVGTDFGFDYLKDQLKIQNSAKQPLGRGFHAKLKGLEFVKPQTVLRKHAYAIVDEADSVMLDEASSSLILSSGSDDPHPYPRIYTSANDIALSLKKDEHYIIHPQTQAIHLVEDSRPLWEEALDRDNRLQLVRSWQQYILQALKAHHSVLIDEAYIIEDGEIQIVDEYTGRRFSDRKWSDGLHQAVEAKEGLQITQESQSMLKIPRQQFFALYEGVCGMTGTALGCEREFKSIFNLSVVAIPPNKPNKRRVLPTRFFATEKAKDEAVLAIIQKATKKGNPILVGTRTIQKSERLVELIKQLPIDNNATTVQLLNARNDKEEAELIADAGRAKTITIATNMAGRGSDIPLTPESEALGGLFVIVSEPHLSNRVDRQLIGRCARQGDPGIAISFVSAEDELVGHDLSLKKKIQALSQKAQCSKELEKKIFQLQFSLDQQAYQSRYKLFKYNSWLASILEKIS